MGDPEKRKLYDEGGMEALEGSGGGEGHSADDIFSMFFGGGGRGRRSGPQKGEDIVHSIKASLEDLYNGKTVRLAISRNKPCQDCEGRGGAVGAEKSCTDCNGRGVRIQLRQIGPGMVQQMQSSCAKCKGTGKVIAEKDKCKSCKGNKVYKDRKVLEVVIEKGMSNGQKIRFSGEADEIPGTVPGDVIIVVQEKEHDTFTRKNADLVMQTELPLADALCGFTRVVTHLDNRSLKIEVPPGTVVEHDSVRRVKGEGMPQHGNPFNKGDLYIQFKVKFPSTLSAAAIKSIKTAIPTSASPALTGEEEECAMQAVDLSYFGSGAGGRASSAHDEDEDGQGGAQRVQCNQG